MRRYILTIIALHAALLAASAQVYSLGADPVAIKWKSLESANFRIIYPEEADSLAREYVRSLESFAAATRPTIGFLPNELYHRKMPVILHA